MEEEIENLATEGKEIERLSMIGYSLGGLVARYAIGLLHSKRFFERITPVVGSSSKLLDRMAYNIYRTSQVLQAPTSAYGHP
jgi:predicted alpha/beta superfamily hydrolase